MEPRIDVITLAVADRSAEETGFPASGYPIRGSNSTSSPVCGASDGRMRHIAPGQRAGSGGAPPGSPSVWLVLDVI